MNPNTEFIPFFKPSLDHREEEAVLSVLRSGWLTTGRECGEFEKAFSGYISSKNAVAVNSGTAGLHLALESLGIGPGDIVLTTPYTFTSSAEIVRYTGAEVRFTDIERDSCNIDPDKLEEAVNAGKIGAVIVVHVGGEPCAMDRIMNLCGKKGIPVIEDAAHCFPLKYNGRFIGTFGDAGVYSFYATKTITTGEGGMAVTDREDLAKRMKVMRLHGIDRDIWNRYTDKAKSNSWVYDVVAPGFKYNLSDIAAAIGSVQLEKAESFFSKRKERVQYYIDRLSGIEGLDLPEYTENHAWHLFMIRIEPEKFKIDRDRFMQLLQQKNIGTSVHFIPLHLMTYYKKRYSLSPEDFPEAFGRYRTSISLPLYPDLTFDQIDRITETIKEICRGNRIPWK